MLRIDPAAGAVEFEGAWHSWGALAAIVEAVDRVLTDAGLGRDVAVGLLLRNRPSLVAATLAVLATRRCVITVNPHQGDARLADEVRALRLPALAAWRGDWDRPTLGPAAVEAGSLGLVLDEDPGPCVTMVPGLERPGSGPHRAPLPDVAVQMLTSGTTGPPKRIELTYAALEQSLAGAAHYERRRETGEQPALRRGVAIISAPLVHVGGLWRSLQCVADGRPIALLERFGVEAWLELVERHRPATVSLVPAALRMVLDAGVPRHRLAGVKAVLSATAPLPPETALAFEERFGIPVLVSYGATEFAGGVAGWTIDDHRRWAVSKRGSVGRAHPGCRLRVVSPDDGRALPAGSTGLLEVCSAQLGSAAGWVRTTDLAAIDDDGFLWIKGRQDNVINRGGFKVVPEEVVRVLETHPWVREASVVGVADARLGEVPVAAVELRDGAPPLDGAQLRAFAREHLVAYQIPRDIRIVASLPRNATMKVSEEDVRALFGAPPTSGSPSTDRSEEL